MTVSPLASIQWSVLRPTSILSLYHIFEVLIIILPCPSSSSSFKHLIFQAPICIPLFQHVFFFLFMFMYFYSSSWDRRIVRLAFGDANITMFSYSLIFMTTLQILLLFLSTIT